MAVGQPVPATRFAAESLAGGFGVQYWGVGYDPDNLSSAPHGILIIEPARASGAASPTGREVWFTAAEIARIRRGGTRPVLAYLNVGRPETYRDYWIDAAPGERANLQAGVAADGGPVAAYWSPAWRKVLAERLDRILDLGFDGVLLDDVLQYYDQSAGLVRPSSYRPDAPAGTPAHARAMMSLVTALRTRSDQRRCGALILVNNGVFIGRDAGPDLGGAAGATFDAYRLAIDGIMIESLFTPRLQTAAIGALVEDYAAAGLPVFDVEIASSLPTLDGETFRATAARNAAALGALTYVAASGAYDRLLPPVIATRPAAQER